MYAIADGKSILVTFTHKSEFKSLCEHTVNNLMFEKKKHSDVLVAHGHSDPYCFFGYGYCLNPYGLLDHGFRLKTKIIVFYKLSKNKFKDGTKIEPFKSYKSRNISEVENMPIGVYYFNYFERKKDKVTNGTC